MDLREHQRNAGRGNAGKPKSPEHRAKILAALKLANEAKAKKRAKSRE